MAPYKKRQLDLKPKHGSSTVKKACPSLVSDCAMKVPVVVLHKLNVEPYQGNRKRNIKEPDHRARSEQDRQEDLVAVDKLTKPPHLGYYSLPPTDEMAPYKKQQLDLKPKHGSSTVKKACPSLVSDCAMKVPVVVLHKLNVEPDQGIRKRNIKEPDHRARSEQDRQEDLVAGDKLTKPPHLGYYSLPPTDEMAPYKKQLDLKPKHGSSTVKKACPSLVSDCAMKVPVVVLHKLNVEPDQGIRKRNIKEPDHRARSEQDRQEVPALGNGHGHDKMVLSPVEQSALLHPTPEFTRNNDQQDCNQKAVCRKQLRVQLVRMNIETKNELEKQATNESDSDHEDVQPTDRSLLNVQHEDQEELSSEKSDSDQFNEQDLEMLSLYERQRLKNIKQNATFLKAIKLHEVSSDLYQLKKNRTIVRREKPQIHTVTRQSNRLQGIAPSLPMAEEQSQFIQKKEQSRRRAKKLWVYPIVSEKREKWYFNELYRDLRRYPDKFKAFCRLPIQGFDRLLQILSPELSYCSTFRKKANSAEERLLITLRFLATGESYTSLEIQFRVGKSTISQIVRRTCNVIWQKLQPIVMPSPTEKTWLQVAAGFQSVANFPNCVGAVGGKHVRVQQPVRSGSHFFNCMQCFSVVLMAVADARYKFVAVDVGAYGNTGDSLVLRTSQIPLQILQDSGTLPAPRPLPGSTHPVPFVMVSNEAFPLMTHLLRPYPQMGLDARRRVFNYRLSRARRYVECAFGIMTNQWRIFHTVIQLGTDTVDPVIKACCVLHNYAREYITDVDEESQQTVFTPVLNVGLGTPSDSGDCVRETFTDYFMSPEGAVHWQ
ncbi:WD repeat-containing protein 76 isoform X1 [Dendrobates tinctorius]|uniref:WD repeat-containing protein 76 isoform X1 n=1 Tax=Dendrobates tinctorius TaxID=92724 RepID=UPI003CC93989